jgi:rhodanese-related sulfurtransferase
MHEGVGMFRRIIGRLRKRSEPKVVSPVAPDPTPVVIPDEEPEPDIEVDAEQLKTWVSEGQDFVLIDIREPHELQSGFADGALLLRMNDIPNRLDELPESSTRLVVYCAAGMRSYGVTHWLREQGWTDAWSLSSGLHGAVEAGFEIVRPE